MFVQPRWGIRTKKWIQCKKEKHNLNIYSNDYNAQRGWTKIVQEIKILIMYSPVSMLCVLLLFVTHIATDLIVPIPLSHLFVYTYFIYSAVQPATLHTWYSTNLLRFSSTFPGEMLCHYQTSIQMNLINGRYHSKQQSHNCYASAYFTRWRD